MGEPANNLEQIGPTPITDWQSWVLQIIFGMAVGFGLGIAVANLIVRFRLVGFSEMIPVWAGISLCCGAFTSFHGHRAWMTPSVFQPEEPPPTPKARNYSIMLGLIGASLVLLPLALHAAHSGAPARISHSITGTYTLQNGHLQLLPERAISTPVGMKLFFFLLATIPGFLLVHAVRTGTGFWRFGFVDRDDTPLNYWFYVVLNAVASFCILSRLI